MQETGMYGNGDTCSQGLRERENESCRYSETRSQSSQRGGWIEEDDELNEGTQQHGIG